MRNFAYFLYMLSLVSAASALTCHVKLQATNNIIHVQEKLDEGKFSTLLEKMNNDLTLVNGLIEVNGVTAVRFNDYQNLFKKNINPPILVDNGFWVVAVTPECEVIDASVIYTSVAAPYKGVSSSHFDGYVRNLPFGTIIIGASTSLSYGIDRVLVCENEYCDYYATQTLAGLGLHLGYSDGPIDYDEGGEEFRAFVSHAFGFVAQKGYRYKAQWINIKGLFSPVEFETSITTPDVYACVPYSPIVDWTHSGGELNDGESLLLLNGMRCDGNITAWRFHAKESSKFVMSVWHTSNDDEYSLRGRTVITADEVHVGDNFYCLDEPIEVKVGDRYSISSTEDGSFTYQNDVEQDFVQDYPVCLSQMGPTHGLSRTDYITLVEQEGNLQTGNSFEDLSELGDVYNEYVNFHTAEEGTVGLAPAFPYMLPSVKYHCRCSSDSYCNKWDKFSVCKSGKCQCQNGFIIDDNTLMCVRENAALNAPVDYGGYTDITDNNPLFVTDDNENTYGNSTCFTAKESDRPYIIVDLGSEHQIHSVTLAPQPNDVAYAVLYQDTECHGYNLKIIESMTMDSLRDDVGCVYIEGSAVFRFYDEDAFSGNYFTLSSGVHAVGSQGESVHSVEMLDLGRFYHMLTETCLAVEGNNLVLSSLCSHEFYYDNHLWDAVTHNCFDMDSNGNLYLSEPPACGTFSRDEGNEIVFTSSIGGATKCLKVINNRIMGDIQDDNCDAFTFETFVDSFLFYKGGELPPSATEEGSFFYLNIKHPLALQQSSMICTVATTQKSETAENNAPYPAILHQSVDEDLIIRYKGSAEWSSSDASFKHLLFKNPLYDVEIGVSNEKYFSPESYKVCTRYRDHIMGGDRVKVHCDEVVTGRYVKIHIIGDGYIGQVYKQNEEKALPICDFDVQGRPAHPFGFPCQTTADCIEPFKEQYLYCHHGICECRDGFTPNHELGICVDTNECVLQNAECEAKCVNVPGSYYCECPPFYELHSNERSCIDKNECQPMNSSLPTCMGLCGKAICLDCSHQPCMKRKCKPQEYTTCQQTCDNSIFPYQCGCHDGYELAPDKHTCLDINECELKRDLCDYEHGGCHNSIGSYTCYCDEGWENNLESKKCIDANECLVNNGGCDHTCTNLKGSYKCGCNTGYHLLPDEHDCHDFDECLLDDNDCDELVSECVNTLGSYTCDCLKGYKKIMNNCQDIDECLYQPCDHECVNTVGSFKCICNDGFDLDLNTNTCSDKNECLLPNACPQGTNCINTLGSYKCECMDGYELKTKGHKQYCIDINECENEYNGGCSYNCINLNGSHYCTCQENAGLMEDGKTCVDDLNYKLEFQFASSVDKEQLQQFHPKNSQLKYSLRQSIIDIWNPQFVEKLHIERIQYTPSSVSAVLGMRIDPKTDVNEIAKGFIDLLTLLHEMPLYLKGIPRGSLSIIPLQLSRKGMKKQIEGHHPGLCDMFDLLSFCLPDSAQCRIYKDKGQCQCYSDLYGCYETTGINISVALGASIVVVGLIVVVIVILFLLYKPVNVRKLQEARVKQVKTAMEEAARKDQLDRQEMERQNRPVYQVPPPIRPEVNVSRSYPWNRPYRW